MSIPIPNIQNFLFTTRYPPDKILQVFPGNFTAIASSTSFSSARTNNPINHSFGDSVFLVTTYSLDNGITWQDEDSAIPDLSTPSFPIFDTVYVNAYATTTQIVVVASNFTTSTKSITYKIIAMSKT